MRRVARMLVPLAIAAAVTLGSAGIAAAHANLASSDPAANALLDHAPANVTMTFTEPPDPKLSIVHVLDVNGTDVESGPVQAVPANDEQLMIPLPADLPTGVHRQLAVSIGHFSERPAHRRARGLVARATRPDHALRGQLASKLALRSPPRLRPAVGPRVQTALTIRDGSAVARFRVVGVFERAALGASTSDPLFPRRAGLARRILPASPSMPRDGLIGRPRRGRGGSAMLIRAIGATPPPPPRSDRLEAVPLPWRRASDVGLWRFASETVCRHARPSAGYAVVVVLVTGVRCHTRRWRRPPPALFDLVSPRSTSRSRWSRCRSPCRLSTDTVRSRA